MKAIEVLQQQNGEVTKAYYAELAKRGTVGEIAVALFRAQKRSSRAKDYRRGRFPRMAYDVKQWSIEQLASLLAAHAGRSGFRWGWKQDPSVVFEDRPSHVIYVDIPGFGQCSFHSPTRGNGPEYPGEWDGARKSAERICGFCDAVMARSIDAAAGAPK